MLAMVIDGMNDRMKLAIAAGDFDMVRDLDAACIRFLQANLPPQNIDGEELPGVMESLARLQATYNEAKQCCIAARNELQQSLQSTGHNRRNTLQYLNVARNLG